MGKSIDFVVCPADTLFIVNKTVCTLFSSADQAIMTIIGITVQIATIVRFIGLAFPAFFIFQMKRLPA
jgi:hypothetical protein